MAQTSSDKLIVTLEKYNRKGSNDSYFFRVAEATDFTSGASIPVEDLGDAGAIGWNTSGFTGMQAHFETGAEAYAVVEVIGTDETYTDKNGVERERINFKLINDITDLKRAETAAKALQVLKAAENAAPRKASRFAKTTPPAGTDLIPQAVPPVVAETATADAAPAAKK